MTNSVCGCKIEGRGTALQYMRDEIVYCLLHVNAERMWNALDKIANGNCPGLCGKVAKEAIA